MKVLGLIFVLFGIMTIFTDLPLWEAIRDITIGYLLLKED